MATNIINPFGGEPAGGRVRPSGDMPACKLLAKDRNGSRQFLTSGSVARSGRFAAAFQFVIPGGQSWPAAKSIPSDKLALAGTDFRVGVLHLTVRFKFVSSQVAER